MGLSDLIDGSKLGIVLYELLDLISCNIFVSLI